MLLLLLLVLLVSNVPEHVNDKCRIDECQCLQLTLAVLWISTKTDTCWKACKANCVTSLSSSSLKVLLTTVGLSVNKLRQALITLAILVPF